MRYILMREKLIIFKTILVDFYTNTHRPGTRGHQWSHLFKKIVDFYTNLQEKWAKILERGEYLTVCIDSNGADTLYDIVYTFIHHPHPRLALASHRCDFYI